MLDAFKLTAILVSGILWGAWLVLVLRKKNVHPIRETLEGFSRLGWMKKVGVLFIVVQLTMFGGAKHGGTNDVDDVTSTNDVELVEGGTNGVDIVAGGETNEVDGTNGEAASSPLLMGMHRPLTSGETPHPHFAAPYRLESVSTNSDISYTLPADGAIRGTWHLTGAYEDVQKVTLDGFAFPLGSDLCTSLWAYTWGKVRPQLKNASNEIAAVGAPMSAIPDVSRFWTAATSNDTYLLTWENFAAGRVPTTDYQLPSANYQLLSAQLELKRNGDFITRSNDVESVWRRRMLCDLDEDGWIDDIDPTPEEFDENGFGPHQSLPVGDNTNYYYWVDLVVDQANARVTFEGEGHSALPDPDFIARAGETNRVMLLIGKTYVIHCDLPIWCVGKEDDEVCVWSEGRSLGILWPIYLDFVPTEPLLLLAGPLLGAPSNGGGDTGVSIHPERAGGGGFSWPDNFCCYTTAADGSPIFCCDGNCGCGGCHTGDITYRIGEHELAYGGWSCGCSHEPDDPHGGEEPPDGPPAGPSVSATFSHDAIIFEDEYENSPGVFVPRRSTDVEAEFYVYGGTNGGSYAFTLTDGGRLQRLGGSYVPRTGTVKAGEDFHIKVRYDAVSASGSEGDIKAKVEFTENGSGRKISNEAELTAVKVSLNVEANAPGNECNHRHVLGVGERFSVDTVPSGVAQVVPQGNGFQSDRLILVAPLIASVNPLKVLVNGVEHVPSISVIEPTGVEACQVDVITYGISYLCAGGIGLTMRFRILPLSVSFSGIDVQEVPSSMGYQTGYFANPYFANEWSHTTQNGAGQWSGVDYHNVTTLGDTAAITYSLPRVGANGDLTDDLTAVWTEGRNVWSVPFGWRGKSPLSSELVKGFAAGETQVFTIDSQGTVQVQKLQQTAERDIFNHVYLNGVLK